MGGLSFDPTRMDPKDLNYVGEQFNFWGNTALSEADVVIVELGPNGILKECEWLNSVVSFNQRYTVLAVPSHANVKIIRNDNQIDETPLLAPFKLLPQVDFVFWQTLSFVEEARELYTLQKQMLKHSEECDDAMEAFRESVTEIYSQKAKTPRDAGDFKRSLMHIQGCFKMLLSIAPMETILEGEMLPNIVRQKICDEGLSQEAFLEYVETQWATPIRNRFEKEYQYRFKNYTDQLRLNFDIIIDKINGWTSQERLIFVVDSLYVDWSEGIHLQKVCVTDLFHALKQHKFAVVSPNSNFSVTHSTLPASLQEFFEHEPVLEEDAAQESGGAEEVEQTEQEEDVEKLMVTGQRLQQRQVARELDEQSVSLHTPPATPPLPDEEDSDDDKRSDSVVVRRLQLQTPEADPDAVKQVADGDGSPTSPYEMVQVTP